MWISDMYLNIINIFIADLAFILYIFLIDMIKGKMNPKRIFIQSLFATIITLKFPIRPLSLQLNYDLLKTLDTIRDHIDSLLKTLLGQYGIAHRSSTKHTHKHLFILLPELFDQWLPAVGLVWLVAERGDD